MKYDLLTFGEVLIRFTAPAHQRLEQAQAVEVAFGGSEANTAIALSRLGLRTAWVSRLPRNPWGERVARELAKQNVDVSYVIWDDMARMATFFVEVGSPPRPSTVIYDRKHSAASQMQPDDLPADLLAQTRLLHCTGITPALSDSCAATVRAAVQQARALGVPVSLDVNYRSRLWNAEQAAATLSPIFEMVTLLISAERDARLLFQRQETGADLAKYLQDRFGCATVVITQSERGSLALADGVACHVPAFSVHTVDRIGAGDAFGAGFLFGYLQGWPLETSLRWGNAAAALKLTIPGDVALFSRSEVEAIVNGQSAALQR